MFSAGAAPSSIEVDCVLSSLYVIAVLENTCSRDQPRTGSDRAVETLWLEEGRDSGNY